MLFNVTRLATRSRIALYSPTIRAVHSVGLVEFVRHELFHSDYYHMKFLTFLLNSTHCSFGLPWDMSIAATALVLRSLVFSPFYIYAEKNYTKVLYIAIDCAKSRSQLHEKIKQTTSFQTLSSRTADRYLESMSRHVFIKTCRANNCHPLKSFATTIVQLPFWLSFTFCLRNICGISTSPNDVWTPLVPDLVTEGLNVACAHWLLPIGLLLTGLANIELMHLRTPRSNLWNFRLSRGAGWFGNLVIFYFSLFVPKAIVVYWTTSAIHQFITHLLVMHPWMRERFGIWLRPTEGIHPYRVLLQTAIDRYALLRRFRLKRL